MTPNELLHYLQIGGVTLWLLLASSLLAVGVAVERLVALWGVSDKSQKLGEAITRHLLRGDVAAARSAADRSDAAVADIYLAGFNRLEGRKGGVEGTVQRERVAVALRLKQNLWILGTLGAVTPFVGLFGTVAGIMRSFRELGVDVQAGGTGGSAAVMTGISEALVATAVGILVAVQAVVFFNYFQARLARVNAELGLLADEFLELLRDRPSESPLPVETTASSKAEG
jgi:biopolymer transport protein ExbB/TolQ